MADRAIDLEKGFTPGGITGRNLLCVSEYGRQGDGQEQTGADLAWPRFQK